MVLGPGPIQTSITTSRSSSSSTPRELLDSSINVSRNQATAAVGSAQSGVGAILGQKPLVDQSVGAMMGAGNAMLPIAGEMSGMGDSMWESGTKVTQQALDTLATGMGFINMDESASPLVAEAMRLYGQVDPDRLAATAAQDVQAQADNARGQTERSLARMGVSPSSGAAMSARSQFDRYVAVARATAMQRAKEAGRQEQRSAFQDLVSGNALKFLEEGGHLASIGSSGQSAAVNAKRGAADAYGAAAGVFGKAGDLGLDYGRALSSAYNALAGIQMKQADNTVSSEALRVNALNGGRGGGGGGGVRIIDNTDRAIQARLAAGVNPIAS